MPRVTGLAVEHHSQPFGIGERSPRLSWKITDAAPGARQTAYELRVVRGVHNPEPVRFTVKVASDASQFVPVLVTPLASREQITIEARCWLDQSDEPTPWSDPLAVEAGLLDAADWAVDFVSPSPDDERSEVRGAHILRAVFETDPQRIARARIYATAHGVYDIELNGKPVGDQLLAPGWTSYQHRLRYQTYDITPQVTSGNNEVRVWLADGWYRGKLGFNGGRWNNYGTDLSVLLQLELTDVDGSVTVVDLSDAWEHLPAPVTSVGLYEGEEHDARAEIPWSSESAALDWRPVTRLPRSSFSAELVAPDGPPVRAIEELAPVAVERRPSGGLRFDFGQNISGKLAITATAPAGHTVVLRHAEVLEHDELASRPLRGAPSIDRYTFAGLPDGEHWTPRFTFHGFRYAEIDNWPGEYVDGSVRAVVVHSDMQRTGYFESSNPTLDKFHENVVWSMRDNFLDLPTDCPQRDERLGWTGDIQVFGPAAAFLYKSTGTLVSWMRDVAAEQGADGAVPNFVPWIECGFPSDSAAGWGDVAVFLPWTLYERTGDRAILASQFESMRRWVDHVAALTKGSGLWNSGFQLGDWLDPTAPPERPDDSRTDRYLVATAYHARSAHLLARAAGVLGKETERVFYERVAERARGAFRREFVSPSGRLVSDTETAISLALVFELLETDEQRLVAGRRLVALVEDSGYVIRTGFIGTPLICDALASVGATDAAYHLLLQTENPSWLYAVTMGATTVWERWDSMLPDGSINPGEMTSFNHYSLGAVVDFMHRRVAGLDFAAPGYRRVRVDPHPGGGLASAAARLDTPFGEVAVAWQRRGAELTMTLTVPTGVDAEVVVPREPEPRIYASGTHIIRYAVRAASIDPEPRAVRNLHNPADAAAPAVA